MAGRVVGGPAGVLTCSTKAKADREVRCAVAYQWVFRHLSPFLNVSVGWRQRDVAVSKVRSVPNFQSREPDIQLQTSLSKIQSILVKAYVILTYKFCASKEGASLDASGVREGHAR